MAIQIRKSNRNSQPVTQAAPNVSYDSAASQATLDSLGNNIDKFVTGVETKADFDRVKAERELEYNNAVAKDASTSANNDYAEKQTVLRNQVETGEIKPNEYLTRSDELFSEVDADRREGLQNAQQKNIYEVYNAANKDRLSPEELSYQATAITNFNIKANEDDLEDSYQFGLTSENIEATQKNYTQGIEKTMVAKPEMSREEATALWAKGYSNNIVTGLSVEGVQRYLHQDIVK